MTRSTRRDLIARAAAVAAAAVCGAPLHAAEAPPPLVPPADRELRVPVRGGSLFVRVNGDLKSTAKPLLMLHGGPGGACWQMFPAVPLARDRAVILYDQLDSGHSDAPGLESNWTIERFASELDAIRAALDLQEFHLLGHSWGGIVANAYAARRPAGLRSLILQGAPLSARAFAASLRTLLAALPDGLGDVILRADRGEKVDDDLLAKATEAFGKRHLWRTSTAAIGTAYMQGTPDDRGDALAKAMTGGQGSRFGGRLADFDDEALLDKISVPTLLLCGEFDIMTPAVTRELLPRLRRGTFAEIPAAGHMIQFDQAQAWRAAVVAFVGAHDA